MRWTHAALAVMVLGGACTTQDFVLTAPAPTVERPATELAASRAALDQRPASYAYSQRGSLFTGRNWETRVIVEAGVAVGREHVAWTWSGPGVMDVVEQWTESSADLGSHEGTVAALTLPQLYEQCRTDILTLDPAAHTFTFELFEDGLLATCAAFPMNCVDGCERGFRIRRIDFAP